MDSDIKNRKDLEDIFNAFYKEAMSDELIGHFFTEVVSLNLETHLPHILDFWEYNLFHKGTYSKNLIAVHKNLHDKSNIEYAHYDQWLKLLNSTIDNLYKGTNTEKLKTNALSIATVMKIKVN